MPRFQTATPKNIPRLYHWQRFVPEHVGTLLRENAIWCSNPATFNDPWDCKPFFSTDFLGDPAEIERHAQWYAEITRRHRPDIPETSILKTQEELRNNPGVIAERAEQVSRGMWSAVADRYRVYCLGPDAGNLLMWSHYAENHKGICLEFSTANPVVCCAQRVEYLQEFPRMPLHSRDEDDSLVTLLTKSDVWSYEKEYRLVAQESDNRTSHDTLITHENYLKLPEGTLLSIIVGCQGPLDDVLKLVNELAPGLPVKQAMRVPNKYALRIE
jgi:hypothetical protein